MTLPWILLCYMASISPGWLYELGSRPVSNSVISCSVIMLTFHSHNCFGGWSPYRAAICQQGVIPPATSHQPLPAIPALSVIVGALLYSVGLMRDETVVILYGQCVCVCLPPFFFLLSSDCSNYTNRSGNFAQSYHVSTKSQSAIFFLFFVCFFFALCFLCYIPFVFNHIP